MTGTAETYGCALLEEEIGEVLTLFGAILQLLGKAGRFGLDTPGVKDPLTGMVDMTVTPRIRLHAELGDLLAAIDYMGARGVLDGAAIVRQRNYKLHKLLDPASVDNLGRRLAP